jgi:FkbM family methyltransferase
MPNDPGFTLHQIEIGGKLILFEDGRYDTKIVTLICQGGYEATERSIVPKLFRPGDRVLEIGTAVGLVTMVLADVVGNENVIGFEANPNLIEDARRNFAANNHVITVKNQVLQNQLCWAGEGSTSDFFIHREYWASSLANKPGTISTVNVPNACFEHEIQAFRANCLVCDIEGGEIDLLTNANLIGIDRIMIEIHYWAGRSLINRLLRKLIFDGFSIDFDLSLRSVLALHRGLEPR